MCPLDLTMLWGIILGNFQTSPPINDRVLHHDSDDMTSERCWDV